MNVHPRGKKALRETNVFDNRNIADHWKHLTTLQIHDQMRRTRKTFVPICENLVGDFNISQIVRSANAFNVGPVVITGRKQWDRRGAVGTHHYIDIEHYSDIEYAIEAYKNIDYTIIAAEYDPGLDMTPLHELQWPDRVVVLLGEEGRGLSGEALKMADKIVYIPMFGTVRSLNVAGCAQIMMYDYLNKRN